MHKSPTETCAHFLQCQVLVRSPVPFSHTKQAILSKRVYTVLYIMNKHVNLQAYVELWLSSSLAKKIERRLSV